jgi:hypothetical protein
MHGVLIPIFFFWLENEVESSRLAIKGLPLKLMDTRMLHLYAYLWSILLIFRQGVGRDDTH